MMGASSRFHSGVSPMDWASRGCRSSGNRRPRIPTNLAPDPLSWPDGRTCTVSNSMITYTCNRCHRALEVDDELAGQKVACPHCGEVSEAPAASRPGAGSVPVARPAGVEGSVGQAGGGKGSSGQAAPAAGSPEAMGLPPRIGSEQTIRTVHPAMFRARPLRGMLIAILVGGGVVGAGVLYFGNYGKYQQVGAVACAVVALAGLVWLGVWKIRTLSTALTLTNKRTILRRGLLSRSMDEMLHDRIQDIEINQTFAQRMWNVGRLELSSAGDADGVIEVADLPNPDGLREIIDAYRTH